MNTTNNFKQWSKDHNFDQERWTPGLLRALRTRYERSQQKLVIDGTGCEWPQRVHRVSSNENTPGE